MTSHARPCPTDPDGAARGGPDPAAPGPSPRVRGWAVVAGSFAVQALCFGAVYSFPAFAAALRASFGVSDVDASLIYAVSGAMVLAVGAVSGPLADRFGARWPIGLGVAAMAAGFLLASGARSFVEVLLLYGLLVGAGAGMAYVPAIAVVQRWFVARRGLASGIATSGVGAGTAMVPVASALLAPWGDWRTAFLITGVLVGAVGLLAVRLLPRSPEARGLGPDGAARPAPPDPGASLEGVGMGRALRSRRYAWLMAGSVLLSVPVAMPYADVVATAQGAGLAASDALWLLSLIGAGSVLGRLVLGAAADGVGRGRTLLACCAGVAATMALWAEVRDATGFVVFALGFGLFQGGFVALLPGVTVDLYGRRAAGGLIGVLFTGRALAVLLGAPCMAALAASAGRAVPLWTACGLALLGTCLLSRALPREGDPRGATAPGRPGAARGTAPGPSVPRGPARAGGAARASPRPPVRPAAGRVTCSGAGAGGPRAPGG